MSLDPEKSAATFGPRVLPDEGSQILRNYAIIDLGTQMESFQGRAPEPRQKIIMFFEFPKKLHVFDEKRGPEPLTVYHEYTYVASDRSKLTKVVMSWGQLKNTPERLNLRPYLGQYCLASIKHKPSTKNPNDKYASIDNKGEAVFPVMQDLKDPQTGKPIGCREYNQNIWFDLDHFSWETFNKLPKFVQDKIRKCTEWPQIIARFPEPVGQVYQHQPTYAQPATNQYQQPQYQQQYQAPAQQGFHQPQQPATAPPVANNDLPNF